MDSISTARDFFINQQGLSPDQADMIVSKGMEAYNQQSQPQQNMMQMASGGIARLGYQMGGSPMGVEAMPMDTGQSLQVPQQMPTNFSSAQSITSNPLLNYGQPQIGQAGGTPLSMNRGGIARLGYQMGGEAMMQPQMGGEMSMPQMNEQQALETIIQLLIEQGVDPETALQLAAQILQIFAQGGEPAVEAFANQLEQQEQVQEMAGGGIAGLYPRQGYFVGKIVKSVGKVVKSVAKAVKSVAKSPIGRIALTIGANMLLPGAGTAFGAALQSAAVNLGIQAIGGGKINPMEALLAGASGYIGYNPSGVPGADTALKTGQTVTTDGATNITANLADKGIGPLPSAGDAIYTNYPSSITSNVAANAPTYTGFESDISSMTGTGYAAPKPNLPFQLQGAGDGSVIDANAITSDYSYPGTIDKLRTSASNYGTDLMNKAQTGIQSLYKDPIGTVSDLASSAYKTVKDNAIPLVTGAVAGKYLFGSPQQPDESDEDFDQRRKAETNEYVTLYGGNLNIKDADFYAREKARNPFAPIMAANGGIMGYRKGGSMVPPARQIEGGIIELDARKSGGYIPYGKKERVDDVPAMLAKDEFVFTSRAVKAAGGGSAKRGAEKMYALMKQLESKGARA
jgi:hypothetical protein